MPASAAPDHHGRAQLVLALRKAGIEDRAIIEAMEKVPRDMFVEAPFAVDAYADMALPIACGQTISQPYLVAYMTMALALAPRMRVLEIGTGSGYHAAVLAGLTGWVYTVERHRPLLTTARQRFAALKLHNVVSRHGDGTKGWPEQAPFDRILLTAAVPEIPPALIDQLKPGGILIAPIDRSQPAWTDPLGCMAPRERVYQYLTKIIRGDAGLTEQALIPAVFVPLVAGLP